VKEWESTMDDPAVILFIQLLVNAKVGNKWVIKTHSHSDFLPSVKLQCF